MTTATAVQLHSGVPTTAFSTSTTTTTTSASAAGAGACAGAGVASAAAAMAPAVARPHARRHACTRLPRDVPLLQAVRQALHVRPGRYCSPRYKNR